MSSAAASQECTTNVLEASWDSAVELIRREHPVQQFSSVALCHKNQTEGGRRQLNLAPQIVGNTCEPWWRRDAIELVARLLSPQMVGLEFGGGSSTIWMAQRVSEIHTIEDNMEWIGILKKQVRERVDGNHSHVYFTERKTKQGQENYASALAASDFLNDGFVDLVSIDGRDRAKCMLRALELLKSSGGILILDNSDRKYYVNALKMVPSHWRRFDSLYPWPDDGTLEPAFLKYVNRMMTGYNLKTTVFLSRDAACTPRPPETALRLPEGAVDLKQHPGYSKPGDIFAKEERAYGTEWEARSYPQSEETPKTGYLSSPPVARGTVSSEGEEWGFPMPNLALLGVTAIAAAALVVRRFTRHEKMKRSANT